MRNGLAALVLLTGLLASAHADYYRFMYVPGAVRVEKDKEGQPGFMGGVRPGFPMPMPQPGQPGFQMGGNFQGVPPGMMGGGMMGGVRPGFPGPMGKPGEVKEYDEDDEIDLTQARIVIIEAKKTLMPGPKSWGKRMIEHKWGKTALHKADDIAFKRLAEKSRPIPTVLERYDARKKELAKEKKVDAEKILETAEFCLTHGLYDKFAKEMDDFVDANGKHPVAVAYKKTRDGLKKPMSKGDAGQAWKDRLTTTFKLTTTPHYAALYNAREADPLDVRARLKRLEENYNAFFYWFALKGIAPTLPETRQVVIFADKTEDFFNLHQAFDGPPLLGDGFLARRENVAIFSMTSLDEAYDLLAKSSNQMWTVEKWSKDDLLMGRFKGGEKPDDSAYAQEVALLLKAMQDECELQAVTYVGSQQLAGAIGLLPGTVSAPLWLQHGIGSFFETPKGAYWSGTAAPHWKYLINFRNWRDDKKLEAPEEVLYKIVTDEYFVEARRLNSPAAWEKANTMAWALTYYLAQNQNTREGFFRYIQELANLPRDMELDRRTCLVCFIRAFGLASDEDLVKGDLNAARTGMKKMAKEWYYEYISGIPIEMPDAIKLSKKIEQQRVTRAVELEAEKKRLNAPGGFPPGGVNPGGPGGPGGIMPPPGGGPNPPRFGPGGPAVGPGGVRQPGGVRRPPASE